jgi:hypothetical protein
MANVSFIRTKDLSSKSVVDGQIVFDTSENKIYLDDGDTRRLMGGGVDDITLSSIEAVEAATEKGYLVDALVIKEILENFSGAKSVLVSSWLGGQLSLTESMTTEEIANKINEFSLTGNAAASNVETGKTFYNSSTSKVTGTLKNLSEETTLGYSSTYPNSKVILGSKCIQSTNTDSVVRVLIENNTRGIIEKGSLLAVEPSLVATAVGLTAKNQTVMGVAGTYTSDATATAAYIYKDKTAYVNGSKLTGTMTVGTLGSFSAAAYSKSQVTLTWTNPAYAPKNGTCFSGVIVRYQTGSYPSTPTSGSLYMGTGSNSAASGSSSYTVGSLSANTTYYFRAWSYFTCSAGNYTINNTTVMVSSSYLSATAKTTATGTATVKSSGTWTVPTNVRSITVTAIGGGGGGSVGYYDNTRPKTAWGGAGGGGGYQTQTTWSVTPGNTITISIGAGGTAGGFSAGDGGTTTVTYGSSSISAAGGGHGVTAKLGGSTGGVGATTGGTGAEVISNKLSALSNGGKGGVGTNLYNNSYSGAGGGGGALYDYYDSEDESQSYDVIGSAGTASAGGGAGSSSYSSAGTSGTANTGGGGGGGYGSISNYSTAGSKTAGGAGGSGVVIITY